MGPAAPTIGCRLRRSGPAATWSGPSGHDPAAQLEQRQGAGHDGGRLAVARPVRRSSRAIEQAAARRPVRRHPAAPGLAGVQGRASGPCSRSRLADGVIGEP